ncbi:MAG: hypothetical protein AAF434_17375 [Pseudomonadota bacterium]
MAQYIEQNIGNLVVLLSAMIALFGAVHVYQKTVFNRASVRFRDDLMSALNGFYPIGGFWNQSMYSDVKKSIPEVRRAAVIFENNLGFFAKHRFRKAVTRYCDNCQQMDWHIAIAEAAFPDKHPVKQRDQLADDVRVLLTFAT